MERESCVFYRSFYEAIKGIPEQEQLKLYDAIFDYVFNDNIVQEIGIAKSMFTLIKPNIDSSNKRYVASVENGKKGGRPKSNIKPNNNLDITYLKSNANLNDNDNVDVNINNNMCKTNSKSKKVYGEYKRIKLTDAEYNKLILDYSKDTIDNQIIKLDEYIESNNNKNKYTNYSLVIRKSISDKWFETKSSKNIKYKEYDQREYKENELEQYYDN